MENDPLSHGDRPSVLERLRRHNTQIGRKLKRQLCLALTVGAALFTVLGLLDLAGLIATRAGGSERPVSSLILLGGGILLMAARRAWFRHPTDKERSA